MTLKAEKSLLRNYIRLQRNKLTPKKQLHASLQIVKHVMNDARIKAAHTLALFISCNGELNTDPLINALWTAGKQVYLPVISSFTSSNLLFLHYTATTSLIVNRLMIKEPQLNINNILPLTKLDILFTPLVAFDKQGQRLGMGGGFYDRILYYRLQSGFYPIGLAHDCQLITNSIPIEKWDVPLPEIITPSYHWRW